MYGLEWLPLYRNISGSETEFYLTQVYDSHAGSRLVVRFFDAAEGVANIQVADPNGDSMPFEWRYVDQSIGQMNVLPEYRETAFQNYSDTCTFNGVGGQPCLKTTNYQDYNDHIIEMAVDVPGQLHLRRQLLVDDPVRHRQLRRPPTGRDGRSSSSVTRSSLVE